LDLNVRIGDDSRASLLLANLASLESTRGHFESGLSFAQRALEYARADVSQPHEVMIHLVLMENYALLGRIGEAQVAMDSARASLESTPTVMNRLQFDLEGASFALLMGNLRLALSLIDDAEQAWQGQELFLQDAGIFERLRSFRAAHTQGLPAARDLLDAAGRRFKTVHPHYYVNLLPMKAWLEARTDGKYSRETEEEIGLLKGLDLAGKRIMWAAQGFLPQSLLGLT
jgi:tetratricopeptide (TPR) repeat protein